MNENNFAGNGIEVRRGAGKPGCARRRTAMPYKKMLSFLLSLAMIAGTVPGFAPITALAEDIDGTISFAVNATTGDVTASVTGSNATNFKYKWSGGGATSEEATQDITGLLGTELTVTISDADNVKTDEISGNVTVYQTQLSLVGAESGDSAIFSGGYYGKVGDTIDVDYTTGTGGTAINKVTFRHAYTSPEEKTGNETYNYTVAAADANANGVITISAIFTHTNKPTVSSVTPSGSDVPLNTENLVITFDKAIDKTTIGTVELNGKTDNFEGGAIGTNDGRWSAEDTLTIPLKDLAYNTRYDIYIDGFKDLSGSAMELDDTNSFSTPATYDITFSAITGGGIVTADKLVSTAGGIINLTITPDNDYHLYTISAIKTGEPGTTVPFSHAGPVFTFTMPAYDVTITATFTKTQDALDREAVAAAKALIDGGTFAVDQAAANTENDVKTWLKTQISDIADMPATGVTAASITVSGFTAAMAGDNTTPSGTNGVFSFTASLKKDSATTVTAVVNGTITATAFTAPDKVITMAAIQGVTVPTPGAIPVNTITETAQYTGIVTWVPTVVSTFGYATVYTATITLTPKSGYTLTGVGINFFTVAGAVATNSADSGVITAEFPVTVNPPLTGTLNIKLDPATGNLEADTDGLTGGVGAFIYAWVVNNVTESTNENLTTHATGEEVTLTVSRADATGTVEAKITVYQTAVISAGNIATGDTAATDFFVKKGATIAINYTIDATGGMSNNRVIFSHKITANVVKTGNGTYDYTVTADDADASGQIEITATFVHNNKPTVSSVTPIDPNVPINVGKLVITFDKAIDTTVVGSVKLNGNTADFTDGPIAAGDSRWDAGKTVLTIPLKDLAYGTTYNISIGGFEDSSGNIMDTDNSNSFTTEVQTYAVTVPGTIANGSVTADKSAYAKDETVTLTVTPDSGYELDTISAFKTGEPVTTVPISSSTWTFTMPDYAVTVTATFKAITNPDQPAVDAAKGLIQGETFTVSQTAANTENAVKTWLVGQIKSIVGTTIDEITTTNITMSNFTPAIEGDNGTPSGTNGAFTFTVSLTKGSANAVTAAINGTITATANTPQYALSVSAGSNGAVSGTASGSYAAGTQISVTAAADSGYHFKEWTAGGVTISITTNPAVVFNMPANPVTLTANFEQDDPITPPVTFYAVTVQIDGNGTASASAASATAGTLITLTATPDSGYRFKEWQVISGGVSISSGNTFNMPATDVTVKAIFELIPTPPAKHPVTVQSNSYGTAAADVTEAAMGTIVNLTATPNSGYRFKEWQVDSGNVTISGSSFTMPNAGVTVTAIFELIPTPPAKHPVIVLSNSYGTASADVTEAAMGTIVNLTATPNSNSYFKEWQVDSGNVTISGSSFTMPDAGVTITAIFVYNGSGNNGGSGSGGSGNGSSGSGSSTPPTTTTDTTADQSKATTSPADIGGGATVTTPADKPAVKNPNGSTTLPGGGTISLPDDGAITVPPGTVISGDGKTVDVPRGWETAEIVYPDGRKVTVEPGYQIDLSNPAAPVAKLNLPFADVRNSDWFYNDVAYAYTRGLFSGTSADTSEPNTPMNRGMIVTVLYRLAGEPNVNGGAGFNDVGANAYYADAVAWARADGIVSGVGDNLFAADTSTTRQDLIVILSRYAEHTGAKLPATREYTGFVDDADSAGYAKDAIEMFFKAGIINGRPEGQLDPTGMMTRAEFAAALRRFIETTKK